MIQKLRIWSFLGAICGISIAIAPFMAKETVGPCLGFLVIGFNITGISYALNIWVSYKRIQKFFDAPYYWEFRRLWRAQGDRAAHEIALARAFDGGILETTGEPYIGAWRELVNEELSILPFRRMFRRLLNQRYWGKLQSMSQAKNGQASDAAAQGEVA